MSAIKAVIFDADGVLLESNRAYARVFALLGKKYGVKIREKEVYPHFGEHPGRILRELLHRRDISAAFRDYRSIVRSRAFIRKLKAVPGASAALRRLSKKYKIAIISGAIKISLLPALDRFGFRKSARLVLGGDDVRRHKPDPEGLRKAMRKLGAGRKETLYVGDAPNDILFGHRAGIRVVAVLTGVMDRKSAKKAGADYIIRDVTKLEKLLDAPG